MGKDAIVAIFTKEKSAEKDTQTINDEPEQMPPMGRVGKEKEFRKTQEKDTVKYQHWR